MSGESFVGVTSIRAGTHPSSAAQSECEHQDMLNCLTIPRTLLVLLACVRFNVYLPPGRIVQVGSSDPGTWLQPPAPP